VDILIPREYNMTMRIGGKGILFLWVFFMFCNMSDLLHQLTCCFVFFTFECKKRNWTGRMAV